MSLGAVCTRNVNGQTLEFGTSGYTMDNVFILYDRASDSTWYPLGDRTIDAVAGPKKGTTIDFLDKPSPMPLADWVAKHPDTTVLLPTDADLESLRSRRSSRAFLGVGMNGAEDVITIATVVENSAAAGAGLRAGDRLLMIDDTPIDDPTAVRRALADKVPGDVIVVRLERDGRTLEVEVELGERP